jgi:dihydrofolate reductase
LKIIITAAVSKNNVIGKDGKVPWYSNEELGYFKRLTMTSPIIMGRKTWESIGKPLIGRLNVIITRNAEFTTPYREVVIFHSLKDAVSFFKTSVYEKIYIIGGAEVYKESIEFADEMILSEMNFNCEGSVYYPEYDGSKWILNSIELFTDFIVHHYIRKENLT